MGYYIYNYVYVYIYRLVGGLEHEFYFSHHSIIFQKLGLNHQPVTSLVNRQRGP